MVPPYHLRLVVEIGTRTPGSRTVERDMKFIKRIIHPPFQSCAFTGNMSHSFATFNIICWVFSANSAFGDSWDFSEMRSWRMLP